MSIGDRPLPANIQEEGTGPSDTPSKTNATGSSVSPASVERFLPSGDEAGTPPGDRAFRPDILGMRAVAVLLVVLVHAQVSFLVGGFIGVDVFFVISGFVITGLLLRERSMRGKTNILAFYGRRARRILPAAMLVIVVTVMAERLFVGGTAGDLATSQARWSSVFLANFVQPENNILHPLPAPFGQYWSLAVEEQFYLVYPLLILVAVIIAHNRSLRVKLGALLALTIVISFTWSVVSSRGAGTVFAYISPFTHAWELAVGGLLAVCTGWFRTFPVILATMMSWVGLGAIVMGAVLIRIGASGYPGYLAAVPVGATALIIAGGTTAPRWGAEVLLKQAPFKWLGLWSFSIYLWHYPVLTVAGQVWGHTTVTTNLLLAGVAIALSAGTYFAVENPIRHWSRLARFPVVSVLGGVGLILGGLLFVTLI